jgi:hypothetical protein
MYGVVNPSGQNTLQAYGALAKAASSNTSPQQGVFGGTLGSVGDSGSEGSSSAAPSSTPTGGYGGGGYGGGYGGGSGTGGETTTGSSPGATTTTRPNAASQASAGLVSLFAAAAFVLFMA